MGLRGRRIPTTEVKVPDSDSFHVRALSLNDISALVTKHGPTFTLIWEKFIEGGKMDGLGMQDAAVVGRALIETAPEAAVDLIALAVYEETKPDPGAEPMADLVRMLPFTVQIEAMEAVVNRTFTTEAELKKVVETVIRAAMGIVNTTMMLKAA